MRSPEVENYSPYEATTGACLQKAVKSLAGEKEHEHSQGLY